MGCNKLYGQMIMNKRRRLLQGGIRLEEQEKNVQCVLIAHDKVVLVNEHKHMKGTIFVSFLIKFNIFICWICLIFFIKI